MLTASPVSGHAAPDVPAFLSGPGRAASMLSQNRPSKAVRGLRLGSRGGGLCPSSLGRLTAEFGRKYVALTLGTTAGLSGTRNVPEDTKKGVVIGESLLESSNSALGWGEGSPPGLPWFLPGPCIYRGRWGRAHQVPSPLCLPVATCGFH